MGGAWLPGRAIQRRPYNRQRCDGGRAGQCGDVWSCVNNRVGPSQRAAGMWRPARGRQAQRLKEEGASAGAYVLGCEARFEREASHGMSCLRKGPPTPTVQMARPSVQAILSVHSSRHSRANKSTFQTRLVHGMSDPARLGAQPCTCLSILCMLSRHPDALPTRSRTHPPLQHPSTYPPTLSRTPTPPPPAPALPWSLSPSVA